MLNNIKINLCCVIIKLDTTELWFGNPHPYPKEPSLPVKLETGKAGKILEGKSHVQCCIVGTVLLVNLSDS